MDEIVNILKNNLDSKAIIDTNPRRRMICVMWADGQDPAASVEVLKEMGFEKVNDFWKMVLPQEDNFKPVKMEEIKANCASPRGLSFDEWIING